MARQDFAPQDFGQRWWEAEAGPPYRAAAASSAFRSQCCPVKFPVDFGSWVGFPAQGCHRAHHHCAVPPCHGAGSPCIHRDGKDGLKTTRKAACLHPKKDPRWAPASGRRTGKPRREGAVVPCSWWARHTAFSGACIYGDLARRPRCQQAGRSAVPGGPGSGTAREAAALRGGDVRCVLTPRA